ncbi:hypothetical protein K3165_00400 [Qipengyuania sp. 1XM1-15A]|uniref:hypothetical protein n=1 Tax=Qipengyuania xiamenensis TaxID=2867237 RepID=UPI001C886670|nr:hypothetical protein [Qipengyuania xiamenensis]MBX7531375.1 hypothetical protein [Qipengyuania xiamenensis]
MIKKTLLLALPFALSACGSPQESDEPAADANADTNEVWDSATLVVGENGMQKRFGDAVGHANFGDSRESADKLLEVAFETAPEQSSNEECGAGPMDFSGVGPLQVAYQDDRFVGWFLRASDDVMTIDGVQPGVTKLSELKQQFQVREIDSTLPGEFEFTTSQYGTIRGFSEADEITALQAGMSCFFR